MSVVKKRPKIGNVVRFRLRYGSAPALVIDRMRNDTSSRVVDLREGSGRHTEIPDEDIVYINGKLTGNEADDDG